MGSLLIVLVFTLCGRVKLSAKPEYEALIRSE
jgi:hypothetical protein